MSERESSPLRQDTRISIHALLYSVDVWKLLHLHNGRGAQQRYTTAERPSSTKRKSFGALCQSLEIGQAEPTRLKPKHKRASAACHQVSQQLHTKVAVPSRHLMTKHVSLVHPISSIRLFRYNVPFARNMAPGFHTGASKS